MNLSISEVYKKIENYRNSKGYSEEKMAGIMGLSNRQAYHNMIKNKTMKMTYFINLINKTDIDLLSFFNLSGNEFQIANDPCPECLEKEKKLKEMEEDLKELEEKIKDKEKIIEQCEELLAIYRDKKGNAVKNSA